MSGLPVLTRAQLPLSADRVAAPGVDLLSLPERAVQFGTGAFLRGFVDAFLDAANTQGVFNGRIVAIGSTGSGRDRAFGEQDGLFTLVARGMVSGRDCEEVRVIGSVSRALSAVSEWDEVLACARNPQLEVVFSNTTEVGIRLDAADTADASPPPSFPAKLARFLYERARTFAFAPSKGVVVVPCELIEDNGHVLRDLVLELADRWGYEPGFARWIEDSVPFVNTLVDRIVPGAPDAAEQAALEARLGYQDALLTTAEHFRLFVIEGDEAMRARLSFSAADPAIVVTPDVAPFREQKVRLLNGAHTISASIGLLVGCETVRDVMTHSQLGTFVRRVLLEEILPTVESAGAEMFAQAVLDRFENPHIRHALADITLHGTTKLRVRLVPTMIRAAEQLGRVPDALQLGFAAHLAYRHPTRVAARAENGTDRVDDAGAQITAHWHHRQPTRASITQLVLDVAADLAQWQTDLRALPGFVDGVSHHLYTLETEGVAAALDALAPVSYR